MNGPRARTAPAALAVALVLSSFARAVAAPPLDPLPSLPSVARVRVEVASDRVLVLEDIALPRGEWRAGDLDLYVAFGAPGAPRAFDARLLAVPDGALEPADGDAGEPLPFDRVPRRPSTAHPLLGRPQMAGAVLHVRDAAFRKAVAPGKMAILRVRTLLDAPPEDAEHAREIVVRLGASNGQPLTLGRVQVVASTASPKLKIARAEAHLCGPDADPYPLAVTPRPPSPQGPQSAPSSDARGPIAPVLAVRHATDDLCVRFAVQ